MAKSFKFRVACRADRRNDARENKRKFEPIISERAKQAASDAYAKEVERAETKARIKEEPKQ